VAHQHDGPVSSFAERVVREALERRLSVLDACESWHHCGEHLALA
jgi:hypothetical protein